MSPSALSKARIKLEDSLGREYNRDEPQLEED